MELENEILTLLALKTIQLYALQFGPRLHILVVPRESNYFCLPVESWNGKESVVETDARNTWTELKAPTVDDWDKEYDKGKVRDSCDCNFASLTGFASFTQGFLSEKLSSFLQFFFNFVPGQES